MNTGRKIVIWCGDAPNQRALANKMADRFNVAGIVIDGKQKLKKPAFTKRLLNALIDRIFFKMITVAWTSVQAKYKQKYPEWPRVPLLFVDSINSDEAYNFTKEIAPDIIIVSGTGLVKPAMLSLPVSIGITNLHTGLSPYVKGGPNCTNWCIANGEFDKIGNTVMWIDKGIDSGNIIASECTDLLYCKSLGEAQWKVLEHAHDLYIRIIKYLLHASGHYTSIPQEKIGQGKLFLTKNWNFRAKKNLLRNLKEFIKYCSTEQAKNLTTIPIPIIPEFN